jgi:hypothetical protein
MGPTIDGEYAIAVILPAELQQFEYAGNFERLVHAGVKDLIGYAGLVIQPAHNHCTVLGAQKHKRQFPFGGAHCSSDGNITARLVPRQIVPQAYEVNTAAARAKETRSTLL